MSEKRGRPALALPCGGRRWAGVHRTLPHARTASVHSSTALDTFEFFLLTLQRTAISHVFAVSTSDLTPANSAVGLPFTGLGRRVPGSDKGFPLSEAAGGRHRSERRCPEGARVPSLAGVLLGREVCLPTVRTLWPDTDPWGRRRLLTSGVWVIHEWWGSIHEAFLMLLFFLLLLLREL